MWPRPHSETGETYFVTMHSLDDWLDSKLARIIYVMLSETKEPFENCVSFDKMIQVQRGHPSAQLWVSIATIVKRNQNNSVTVIIS